MPVGPGQFFVRILSRAIKRWISRPNGPPGFWPLLSDGPVMRNLPHPSPGDLPGSLLLASLREENSLPFPGTAEPFRLTDTRFRLRFETLG